MPGVIAAAGILVGRLHVDLCRQSGATCRG
ncbi:putative leader peptide [Streptomyces violaceus]